MREGISPPGKGSDSEPIRPGVSARSSFLDGRPADPLTISAFTPSPFAAARPTGRTTAPPLELRGHRLELLARELAILVGIELKHPIDEAPRSAAPRSAEQATATATAAPSPFTATATGTTGTTGTTRSTRSTGTTGTTLRTKLVLRQFSIFVLVESD